MNITLFKSSSILYAYLFIGILLWPGIGYGYIASAKVHHQLKTREKLSPLAPNYSNKMTGYNKTLTKEGKNQKFLKRKRASSDEPIIELLELIGLAILTLLLFLLTFAIGFTFVIIAIPMVIVDLGMMIFVKNWKFKLVKSLLKIFLKLTEAFVSVSNKLFK